MAPTAKSFSPRGTFFCSFAGCSATFPRLDRLAHHTRIHTGERPYECPWDECDKSYTRREHLRRHIAVYHKLEDAEEENFKCYHCSKLFKTKDTLKKHIHRFHEDTSLVCEICEKKFRKHRKLKEHLFEHTGVKPFPCTREGCDKAFVVWANLRRHMKSHDGYPCDHKDGCSEIFATWTLLRKHIAEKHSPVPTCEKCGRKFSCKSNLKVHLPSHDDTRKSYHCTYDDCPRYFFFMKNLQHHTRSYHLDKKHPCPFENCGQNFINQTKLKNHLRLHDAKYLPPKNKKKNRRKALKRKERAKALPRKATACVLSGHQVSSNEEMKLIKGMASESELVTDELMTDVEETLPEETSSGNGDEGTARISNQEETATTVSESEVCEQERVEPGNACNENATMEVDEVVAECSADSLQVDVSETHDVCEVNTLKSAMSDECKVKEHYEESPFETVGCI